MESTLLETVISTERELSPLIAEYKDEVIKLDPSLIDLRLLGSFGTGNEQKGSDLDPWLVLRELPNLEDLSVLSRKEFEVRQMLSAKYKYPNLARHRATILSKDQTDIYMRDLLL
jgi:predicted nucleotidyltransferase